MLNADPSKVSARAKKRGLPQMGTLGAGNHCAPWGFFVCLFAVCWLVVVAAVSGVSGGWWRPRQPSLPLKQTTQNNTNNTIQKKKNNRRRDPGRRRDLRRRRRAHDGRRRRRAGESEAGD